MEWFDRLLELQGFKSQLDQYRFTDKPIQKSDMHTIMHAQHKSTRAEVAIKVINKTKLDEISRTQFKSETAILYRAKNPNIVKVVEAFETSEHAYLVMEFYDGGDLQMYMQDRNFQVMEEERAQDLIRKVAQGLKYLHDRGIVHRDLKPENILMSDASDFASPIISDFGFAKRLTEGKNCTRLCGTKNYMAPELLAGKPYSKPVDIWSLGVMLYALTSTFLPFKLPKEKLTEETATKWATTLYATKLEFKGKHQNKDELQDLLTGMLKKDPSKRLTINGVLRHSWLKN